MWYLNGVCSSSCTGNPQQTTESIEVKIPPWD